MPCDWRSGHGRTGKPGKPMPGKGVYSEDRSSTIVGESDYLGSRKMFRSGEMKKEDYKEEENKPFPLLPIVLLVLALLVLTGKVKF
jgi:hypothetical protein